MKRFAAFLLTLLLVFTLCSCGKKHVEEQTVPPAVEDQTGEQQPEVKPAPQPVKPEVKPDDAEDETVTTAPVTPVVKPAEEVKPQGGTSGGGHHSGGSTVKNLTITEGKNVSGGTYKDVIIAESVGDGTVTLENVTIDGQLIIRGGGSNSVKVKNSKVKEVKLDKDTSTGGEAPRLELTGTEVKTVEVAKPAIVEATDAASAVQKLSAKDDVTIKGKETKVQNVTVPTEAKENVKLTVNDAAVEKVDVNKAVTIETNAAMGKTPVQNVEAKANVTVTGAATNVGKVTVPEETKNAVKLTVTDAKVAEVSAVKPVTIEANENASKIEKVEALDTVTVQGDTQIDKVEAKADVTVAGEQTKINTITVPAGVTTAPEIKVTKGSVNTVDAKSAASVSGGEDAIANVEAAAPVTVDSKAVAKVTVVNVTVNVTVTVNGKGEIEVAVDTDANVNIAAEIANNVSVSTTQTVTTNITVTAGEVEKTVHIHKWVESGREEATCTGTGYITYTCSEPGCTVHTKTEVVPAKGHVEVVIPAVDPTCTAAGHTAGKKCAVCSTEKEIVYIVEPEPISARGHDFTGSLVSDETGHWHVCPRCGEIAQKTDHDYPPTSCTAAATCRDCGYVKKAGTHTWEEREKTDPTCTTAGSVKYTCTSCHIEETRSIPALGHVYGAPVFNWNDTGTDCTAVVRSCERNGCNHTDSAVAQVSSYRLKNPTCTETGVTVYTATVVFDGTTYSATTNATVNATGHTGSNVTGQAATCEVDGWNDYYKCSKCQKLFSDENCENEITNLGVWKAGDGKVAALGHTYGTPTYEWDGNRCTATRVCENDGNHKETETVTATKIVTQSKTCTLDELSTYTATFTNSAFEVQTQTNVKTADKLGHSLTKTEAKAAACESTGNNEYWTCSRCEKVFSDAQGAKETTVVAETIAALGHQWSTVWSKDATDHWHVCTREGCTAVNDKVAHVPGAAATEDTAQTCTVCGYKLAPATGHLCVKHLTEHPATAATCTTAGNSAYWSCECGKYYSDANAELEVTAGSWVLSAIPHTFDQQVAKEKYLKSAATCTAKAVYYKSCTCGAEGTETFTSGEELGHQYDEPTWTWTDYTSAKAAFACTRSGCTHTEEVIATGEAITSAVTTPAGCDSTGTRTYTATVTFDGVNYTNSKTKTVDADGHEADKQAGQAATCEADGWKDYYRCSVCNKYFSDANCESEISDLDDWKTKGGKVEATGHAYSTTPAWSWAEDHTTATATFTCNNDNSHTVSVTASGTDITHEDATNYNTEGTRTYTATVVFDKETYQATATKALPATPFKVDGNTYATYAEALAAAKTAPKHIVDESFGFEYDRYPTIEIYGSCTMDGNLHLATGTSIAVKNGGSLTVGSLTLDESTMNGFWLDAGTLRLEKGSSFKLGNVQYTGEGGAFVMGDASSNIELAGRAPDMGDNVYVVAVFNGNITQQNTFAMDSSYMFFNEQNSVLTVKGTLTNNAYVDNRGTIIIDGGMLTNNGTIDNESDIAKAMGVTGQIVIASGTLNDSGHINGGIINKTASSAADITAMSNDESVSTILVSSSITVEEDLTVKHPLTVAEGGSLTVNSGVTLTFAPTNTSYWVISNLAVEQGGTITVNGTVKTVSTIDEHDFTKSINAQVAVIGGTFDAENGTVAEDSTIMFNSGTCKVPQSMTGVNVLRGLFGEEATEENLRAGLAETILQTVIVQDPIDLKQSEDLVIPTGKTLQIDSGAVDAYGCNIINNGTIEINASCSLVVENGGTLTNNGTIKGDKDGEINIGDYIYGGLFGLNNVTSKYIENGTNTVPVKKAAAVFTDNLKNALNNYDYVIPSGTETANNLNLDDDLTVPAGKILILKEQVIAGDNVYHNSFTLSGDMTLKGQMVTKGNPDVTVTGRIDAYDFLAFDSVTIDDYVYAEKEMMIVSTALTVSEGGTLEIGSGCTLNYMGQQPAVINGTLMNTVRYMNGIGENSIGAQSQIQGNIRQPNATLTTLVITENTILHGQHEVDTVIPIQYEDDDNNVVAPTLRMGANSWLNFNKLYTGEGGTEAQIIGLTETEGGYTVLSIESSAVTATNTDAFLAALDDPEVTDITITEDITLTYADNLWNYPITKAVTVAEGVTLEVEPYDPETNSNMEEPGGMKFNGLMIAANGSLTLGDHATLKTYTYRSGANEPWYEYRSQVNVNGGILDAADGVLATGDQGMGNIDFEVGNGQLILPDAVDNYLITYTVDSKEELLDANKTDKTDNHCNNILLKSDVVLTENYTVNKVLTVMNDEGHMYRLTVVPGKTLTVPEYVTLYVNGEVRVEGTLDNNGTIVGEGFIDVMGGTLDNGGTIDLSGEIGVEKGGTLRNSSTVSENTSFTLADYWYSDGEKETYVLAEGTTLNSLGNKVTIMAVAFSPDQVRSALGEEKYGMVMACGENEESTVKLKDITVPAGKTLMLKDYVDVGERTIHNAYRLEKITFGQDAGIVIMGDPVVNVTGALDYSRIRVMGNPAINAPGFVHNAEELMEALPNGGDIYLLTLPEASKTDVYMDGQPGRESQYHIESEEPYTISTHTNLIGMTNESLAVFFDGGFTVAPNKTLRFDGLNVVAAANNSTVNGRVEICNGILVVQANSEDGATLTNLGTIQVGNPNCDGKLAIFPKQDKDGEMFKNAEQIVNRGTIERFGEIINWNWNEGTNHEPLEFANYADIVCDLYNDFRNYPNLVEANGRELVHAYSDHSELYHEPNDDKDDDNDALDGFSWLIENEIIDAYDENNNPELRPYHYVTRDEVQNLFNAFAREVLATDTDLVNIVADDDAERLLCRTKNIAITEQDGNKRYISERDQCFDALRQALSSLQSTEVANDTAFMEALDNPLLTEIHVTGTIELNGYYYKDGHPEATETEGADGPAVYLEAAGRDHNEHREIFVEPGASLIVAEDVKMDIRQNVKLRVDNGGQLIVKGNVNVFGDLEPDENDRSRITVVEGGNISYFGNAYFFGERLLKVAGEYMSQKDVIPEGYDRIDDWDNNEQVTCLVAYGLQPESDENGSWWNFDRPLEYREMKTVLENVYQEARKTSSDLPGSVAVGDGGWPKGNDILDNRKVEELLGKFALVLPKKDDKTTNSFVIQHTNSEDNTDGKTIIGKTFTNAITVTAVKTNNNFAGELNFVNCTFNGGITLVYNPDCDYRVNFNDSCTGAVTTDYPEGITGAVTTDYPEGTTGGDRRIRIAHPNGMTITANALTAFEMNDGCLCSTDSFTVNGLTIDGNGCKNIEVDVRTNDTTPTIEVTGSEDGRAIELSGSYTGKLRVSGYIDVSDVTLGTDSRIELANWHNTENGDSAPNSSITLGGNDISINDDWGEQSFTGSGTIHVNGAKAYLQLTVNNRNLANPHVFGGNGNYAIFLGLADVNGVTFEVKENGTELTGKAVRYDKSGIAGGSDGFDGSNVEKTHLEKDGEKTWINDPDNISLTVTVTNGCTVMYDNLRYDNGTNGTVVDQGQTG